VVCDGKKVSCLFKESQENPEAAKTKALRQIDQTGNALNNAQNRVRIIIERFRDAVKNNRSFDCAPYFLITKELNYVSVQGYD
jgi:hypothetical protein